MAVLTRIMTLGTTGDRERETACRGGNIFTPELRIYFDQTRCGFGKTNQEGFGGFYLVFLSFRRWKETPSCSYSSLWKYRL